MMNLVSVMNTAIITAGMGMGTATMTTIDRRQLYLGSILNKSPSNRLADPAIWHHRGYPPA
jgi:hypothetical protein